MHELTLEQPQARYRELQLTFESADPPLLGHFWSEVTGYRSAVNEPDYIRLDGDGLGVAHLVFVEVADWKATRNRLRVELVTDDLERELDRLIALGATPFDRAERHGERRVSLRDPEGNEFTLVEPRRDPALS
jgi:predicted enzyme related to lactoylglutathione lyase